MQNRARAGAAIAAGLLALSLSACSGEDEPAAPATTVAAREATGEPSATAESTAAAGDASVAAFCTGALEADGAVGDALDAAGSAEDEASMLAAQQALGAAIVTWGEVEPPTELADQWQVLADVLDDMSASVVSMHDAMLSGDATAEATAVAALQERGTTEEATAASDDIGEFIDASC